MDTPGEEGLVLLDSIQLVGRRIAPLTWKLPLGVLTSAGARDVDVAAAEVAAAL